MKLLIKKRIEKKKMKTRKSKIQNQIRGVSIENRQFQIRIRSAQCRWLYRSGRPKRGLTMSPDLNSINKQCVIVIDRI